MMNRVTREELSDSLIELLQDQRHGAPPEVPADRIDERTARYVTALRHGHEQERSIFLRGHRAQRLNALAAVVPSPFDQEIFGLEIGRLQTIEVTGPEEARRAVRAAERAAISLGYELLFARVSPSAQALSALIREGFGVYGATVLYAGIPELGSMANAAEVEIARDPREIGEAARLARLGFDDTHLSRDTLLDFHQGRALYEAWVKAEAERGARVFVVRDKSRIVAMAVCRKNDLAAKMLGRSQWHLHLLAVHPRHRGAGLGARVVSAAFHSAIAEGAELIQTGVDTASLGAQRIYAKLGLRPCGSSLVLHRWLKKK